jgi:putative ABC transport system permease protein
LADFSDDDDRPPAANRPILLGNRFWRTQFQADPNILGRTLRLDGDARVVVGVLPPGEPWIDRQIFLPFAHRADADRTSFEFAVVARLRPGVSAAAARADLARVGSQLETTYPEADKGLGFSMDPSLRWVASDSTRRALWVLLGAVGFLLLIACSNLANLLLARGMSRQREVAVRTALGAGRARLVRFVMMESLLLCGFGAALGLALAFVALRVIRSLEFLGIPRLDDAGLNLWVLGFAALVGLATGIFCGLVPALRAPADRIAAVLRDGDRQSSSRGQGRLRAVLVAGEVALSFLLLVGAGLLIRSFGHLLSVSRGFETENRLIFTISMPGSYWQNGVGKEFLDRFFARLQSLPKVIAAGAVNQRPVEGGDPGMGIDMAAERRAPPSAGWRIVTPDYFRAVGLPLVRGPPVRRKRQAGVAGTRPAEAGAARGDQPAPGDSHLSEPGSGWTGCLSVEGQSGAPAEVIGVVADSRGARSPDRR